MRTGALDRLFELTPGPVPTQTTFTGRHATDISPFAVAKAATLSVAGAHVAAHQLAQQRGLTEPPPSIDREHALASFSGYVRVNGKDVPKWAELSGTYDAQDGRVLIHCNFEHHARGVLELLAVEPTRPAVAAAIAKWGAAELEAALIDRGMICAKYRSLDEWERHPHGRQTADLPLMTIERLGDAPPRPLGPIVDRALDGVRVLDCSRVLAGPVGGQTLAAHGADVLRIGASHLAHIPLGVIGTGFGKRNAFVDLETAEGRAQLGGLAADAHLFLDAFRPGALEAKGYSGASLAQLAPGIVVVQISAFDWIGPWARRRGFDSIVQATTGLADQGGVAAGVDEPLHLPVQALDYATGFLAAHAAMRLIAHQQRVGGSWLVRLSLLRTRNWLVDFGLRTLTGPPLTPPTPDPWLGEVDSDFGRVSAPRSMHGRWDRPPAELGSSPPVWLGES